MEKVKNKKSPGEDNRKAKMIKYREKTLMKMLYRIKSVEKDKKMSQTLITAILCLIHKKEDKVRKLATLIANRLKQHYGTVIGGYQSGLRRGRSVVDQIILLQQLQEQNHQ